MEFVFSSGNSVLRMYDDFSAEGQSFFNAYFIRSYIPIHNIADRGTMGCAVNFFKFFALLVIFNKSVNSIELSSQDGTSHSKRSICPGSSSCVPIESCAFLNNMINRDCILSNNIGDLGCGFQGSGLVCCPQVNESPTLLPGKMVDGNRCGISQVQGEGYEDIGAYPWVVRVGFRNVLTGEMKYPCTGSIINNRVILTAAHCALAKADGYKLYAVRVGEWQTNTELDCGDEFCALPVQDIAVSHVVVHPGYQKQTFSNNIALLVLRTKMNYTVTAQPICLPESYSVTSNNGLLVGWGKAAGQTYTPPRQQALHLPIISIQECIRVYGRTLPVSDEQVCAAGEQGNDACSGFGGAPLMVRHGDTHYQVGILSFGSDQCGAAGVPSVYTNIKKYVTWIRENTPQVYDS